MPPALTLDIGCGNSCKGDFGIDDIWFDGDKVKNCCLGFNNFPFESEKFDKVIANHVLEHIPGVWFSLNRDGFFPYYERFQPLQYLFNEVYRVLKPGGRFEIVVPRANTGGALGDPTHLIQWELNTIDYFSGDYMVGTLADKKRMGHTSNFSILGKSYVNNEQNIQFVLRADK